MTDIISIPNIENYTIEIIDGKLIATPKIINGKKIMRNKVINLYQEKIYISLL